MIPLVLLLSFAFATCKPHRTVASKSRANKPLQAADTFTGTICASCEEIATCGENSTAVQTATVTVDGTETEVTIESDGTFTLDLAEGEHTIEVTATCPYANGTDSGETVTSTQTVTIEAEEPRATASFIIQCNSLCPITVPVVVQVCMGCNETTGCDENGTSLIEGRMMALVPVENGTDVPSATIDAEGNATFDSVLPGDYYVHVYDEPYGSSTIEVAGQITVAEGDPDAEEQETQYFGTLLLENSTLCYDPTFLAGRVCADCNAEPPTGENPPNGTSDGCTNPLANATVRLTVISEDGTEATVEATTDELGNYQLEPANLTGNYTLEVFATDCTGSEDEVFAQITGEINATNPTPRTEVNVSAFCTLQCTANITGIVYVAENDTANYTEGITEPLEGITVDLFDEDATQPLIVASVVTSANGTFEFLNVPFSSYLVIARDVPTAGGPTGVGCSLRYDDISVPVEVETNITYNVPIVREQECNNATLCGQILFAANYCTDSNTTDNATLPVSISFNATNCSCSSSPFVPFPPRPCPGRPMPPPPPPFYGNTTNIESLWRAFLLGTNYPALGQPTEEETEEEEAPQLQNSKRKPLKNQRCPPPRRCPPIPPFVPPPPPIGSNTSCNCAVNGSFQGCFEVLAPMPTAIARLYRVGTETFKNGTAATTLYQSVAETQVLPNGSFCFVNLPEADNYVLELVLSENDTLDLTSSNISDALGAITSTVVTQEGAYPPTQQIVSFGPMTLTGDDAAAVDPFTAVFTNDQLTSEATVRISNVTFAPIPDNTTNSTLPDNSTDVLPSSIRFVDPFGSPYMYPLSAKPKKKSSAQIVTPSSKKPLNKPKTTVLRDSTPASSSSSTVKVLRPQPATSSAKKTTDTRPTIRRPTASSSSSSSKTKTTRKSTGSKTTSTKTVTTTRGSSTTVTRRS